MMFTESMADTYTERMQTPGVAPFLGKIQLCTSLEKTRQSSCITFLRLKRESLLGARYQNCPSCCLQQLTFCVLHTQMLISYEESSDNNGMLAALGAVQHLGRITIVKLSASPTSAASANMLLVESPLSNEAQ
jgi:hypothetical protein